MKALRSALGSVVGASIKDDFSTRVPANLDEAELNGLAEKRQRGYAPGQQSIVAD